MIDFEKTIKTHCKASIEIEWKMSHPNESIQSPTTINDLNDDVLREVFAQLDDFDLLAVANVNTTFRRNAQEVISTRYKHKRINIWIRGDKIYKMADEFYSTHRSGLPSVFRNFGTFIKNLTIDLHRRSWQELSDLINRYCGESLNELALSETEFTADHVQKMQPLLSRITNLNLTRCSWQPETIAAEMFSFCSELQCLVIGSVRVDAFRAPITDLDSSTGGPFPKLESFSIKCCNGITTESIQNLLAMNPQLKKLRIIDCQQITSQIFPTIALRVPEIESITFKEIYSRDNFIANAICLKDLRRLKNCDCALQRT